MHLYQLKYRKFSRDLDSGDYMDLFLHYRRKQQVEFYLTRFAPFSKQIYRKIYEYEPGIEFFRKAKTDKIKYN